MLEHVGGTRPDSDSAQFDCKVCTETANASGSGCRIRNVAQGSGGRDATEEGLGESGGHLEPPGAVA
eukprot:3762255-Rhodomonas_salina.1